MNITSKTLPKSQILLIIELENNEWEKYRTQALKKLAEKASLPGFRKGHVPEKVLVENIGPQAIFSETVELALPQSYIEAVKKESIRPIAQPEIKMTSEKPFTYEATISVEPEVSVKPIAKLNIQKKKIEVSKKEVDETIAQFQDQLAEKKSVDRTAQKEDIVTIDFTGFDEGGAQIDGTSGKNHPVTIGSKTMIPGFENELKGLKKGDTKSFYVTFPKDYKVKRLASKKVKFDVSVHDVQEKILPKVDESFVEKLTGQKKKVEDLRKEIESSLKEKKKNAERQEQEGVLLTAVEKRVSTEIPDILIDDEVNYLLDNMKMQGLQYGITWENQLVHLKKSEDELKKELRAQGEKQVRTRLGIQKFLELDNISVPEGDIQNEVNAVLGRMNKEQREKQEQEFQKGARGWREAENRLRVRKWIDQKLQEFVK